MKAHIELAVVGVVVLLSGCDSESWLPTQPGLDLGRSVVDLSVMGDLSTDEPQNDMGPTDLAPSACVASNYLDVDSFSVVANRLDNCLGAASNPCTPTTSTGESSLTLSNLEEGVGTIVFLYQAESGGTHSLTGMGTPSVAPAPPGIVFKASGIPEDVSFEKALKNFYAPSDPADFQCTWQ